MLEIIIPIVLIILFFWFFFSFIPTGLWISARASGAAVGLISLVGMRLRRVPPKVIVEPRISAARAGIDLDIAELESHYLAGGDVNKVVLSLISADKAGIELDFKRASAIDLAGRDVLEAVKMSVNPKVITTPVVAAVAKDGIQVKAISRVTADSRCEYYLEQAISYKKNSNISNVFLNEGENEADYLLRR